MDLRPEVLVSTMLVHLMHQMLLRQQLVKMLLLVHMDLKNYLGYLNTQGFFHIVLDYNNQLQRCFHLDW